MSEFNLTFPTIGNQQEAKMIKSGELLFLVGANGSGKSTLMHEFAKQNRGKVRRIAAHRQVWFQSNAMDLTPASRQQNEVNIANQDRQDQSRYRDDYAAQRSQVTIFDLIDSENVEARRIAEAARMGDMKLVEELAREQAPLSKMNDILRISNLDISILVEEGSKLMAVRGSNPPYSIAELSDGENDNATYETAQYIKDKVDRAKSYAKKAKQYEADGKPESAENEIKKIVPSL